MCHSYKKITHPWQMMLILLIVVLTGCATSPPVDDGQLTSESAEQIYANGRSALLGQQYQLASQHFKKLEANYPDSPYNQQAQMELAYAYFKAGDFTTSIATAERLIRNYPANDNLDYSYYLKALASFEQASQLTGQSQDSEASILAAQTALRNFNDLTEQFPGSKYQQDADKRIEYLQEQLAQYEVTAARHDIEQGNHASAVIHARNVVENYPQTRSAADALVIVDMGYEIMSLGQPQSDPSNTSMPTDPVPNNAMSEATASTFTTVATASAGITEMVSTAAESVQANEIQNADTSAATTIEPTTIVVNGDTIVNEPGSPSFSIAGAHSSQWILQQPADQYTIQLISTLSDETLSRFIQQHALENKTAYYRKQVDGKTRHTLIYGIFNTIDDARAAITKLPVSIQNGKPWVLGLETVHKTINTYNSSH